MVLFDNKFIVDNGFNFTSIVSTLFHTCHEDVSIWLNAIHQTDPMVHQGHLLLTWFNFNPNMDK